MLSLTIFLLTLGAVARLTRLITDDRVTSRLRVLAITKLGVDHPVTYWLTCPWCVSPYLGVGGLTLAWFYGSTAPYLIIAGGLTISYLASMSATHLDGRTDR